jgi:hypothetical protein
MDRQAKQLQAKAKKNEVALGSGPGEFLVTSSTSGKTYRVREVAGGFVCCCKWASYRDTRKHPCTHVLAVEEWLEQASGRRLSFWADKQDAQRQHRPTSSVGVGLLATSRGAQ